jgi:SnoaL-like domain
MGQWSRDELEEAWRRYQDVVVEVGKTWDWSSYADVFTEDATYVEHALGNVSGREAIREWIVSTMNMFPGSEMPFYPVSWYSVDVDKGWIINKNVNTMRDPGDGKWSYEEDAYNPMNFLVMVQGYIQRCHELGTITDDARTFAKNMNWQLS